MRSAQQRITILKQLTRHAPESMYVRFRCIVRVSADLQGPKYGFLWSKKGFFMVFYGPQKPIFMVFYGPQKPSFMFFLWPDFKRYFKNIFLVLVSYTGIPP